MPPAPWEPVPILLAMAEPNGPVEQAFFDRMMTEWEARIARRRDGSTASIACCTAPAWPTDTDHDPEGTLLALVRRVVGPDVPVVASYDLHANVSDADVDLVNAYIGYRTNPHLDMRERGAESAQVLRRLLSGTKTHLARVRLPIVPPTVSMLTGKDAHERPYGEMIDLGQQRMREPPYAGRVLNVSVMGGFAYADTPFNGLTVVVTATDPAAAQALAREIAEAGWARRERFRAALTSLDDAVRLAQGTADRAKPALIFADVADNPGGGGRGNTMWILEAFPAAGVKDALVGVIHDPALAAEAHALGEGARFTARFNRVGGDEFSKPFSAPATVRALRDATVRGRRGIYANNTLDIGPSAALQLDGITVVVISNRFQCADPDLLRGIRPRHRRGARRGGEIARPFPRRLRRILPPRPGDRGRRARPDQPDPVALSLAAHAAPRAADRRDARIGPRRRHEARRPADAVPGARPDHPAAQHRRHGTRRSPATACRCART